jgi:hypothetical protein
VFPLAIDPAIGTAIRVTRHAQNAAVAAVSRFARSREIPRKIG